MPRWSRASHKAGTLDLQGRSWAEYGAKAGAWRLLEAYTRTLQRILDGWPSLPPRPACLDVTVHAHVYGRPMGAVEFVRSLQAVAYAPDAFLTEHDALGSMFAG